MDRITLTNISSEVTNHKRIAIAGHIRPDGDCIGSCTALYNYLNNNRHIFGIEKIDVYLEPFGNEFSVLKGSEDVIHSYESDEEYDLFISLDCGSLDRLGNALKYFKSAKNTLNIDHHVSNDLFAQSNHVVDYASSTCEVLFELFDYELITKEIGECLYVGLIHDTGVFKHSNTSERTLQIAGRLVSTGINFSQLIDESFYSRSYMQTQLLGRCLMESILMMNGQIIVSSVSRRILELYDAKHSDLDGIIDHLRVTKGVEVAIFLYETGFKEYKVSMRSNGEVNVSKIGQFFGGGGHIKAAGCTMMGSTHDVINNLTPHIEAQLKLIQESKLA